MHGVGPPLETAGQDGGRRWKRAKGKWVTSPCLTSTQHDWVLPLLPLGLGGPHQGRNSERRDHLCSKAAREPHPSVQAHKRLGLYLLECGTRVARAVWLAEGAVQGETGRRFYCHAYTR